MHQDEPFQTGLQKHVLADWIQAFVEATVFQKLKCDTSEDIFEFHFCNNIFDFVLTICFSSFILPSSFKHHLLLA
jgi:hypothetical protein